MSHDITTEQSGELTAPEFTHRAGPVALISHNDVNDTWRVRVGPGLLAKNYRAVGILTEDRVFQRFSRSGPKVPLQVLRNAHQALTSDAPHDVIGQQEERTRAASVLTRLAALLESSSTAPISATALRGLTRYTTAEDRAGYPDLLARAWGRMRQQDRTAARARAAHLGNLPLLAEMDALSTEPVSS